MHALTLAQSTCIGCGCTDTRACFDDAAGQPCHWLRLDRAAALGVCSCCTDAATAWDAGDRRARTPVRPVNMPDDVQTQHLRQSGAPYTESDLAFLREHYARLGARKCAERLGRSAGAVTAYACKHRIGKLRRWTTTDDDYLREHYSATGAFACAKDLGRTVSAIKQRVAKLQVGPRTRWTPAEDAFLVQNKGKGYLSLRSALGRSQVSIRLRAKRLNVVVRKSFDDSEVLARLRKGVPVSQIVKDLHHAHSTVRDVAHRHGIKLTRGRWLPPVDESEVVSRLKKDMQPKVIGAELHCSEETVLAIGRRYGIRRRPGRRPPEINHSEVVQALNGRLPIKDIARQLQYSLASVRQVARMHGIERRPGRPASPVDPLEIVQALKDRVPVKVIARERRCHARVVREIARLNGIELRTGRRPTRRDNSDAPVPPKHNWSAASPQTASGRHAAVARGSE